MPFGDYHGSWQAMEELYASGKIVLPLGLDGRKVDEAYVDRKSTRLNSSHL